MTEPTDGQLFDVPEPRTPVELLLSLSGNYTRHNDALALFRPTHASGPELGAHANSAAQLAHESLAAVKAVQDQQLYASADLIDATVRIKQIAYLSSEAARHLAEAQAVVTAASLTNPERTGPPDGVDRQVQLAQELTALAPEAAVESATGIARETQRRRPAAAGASDGLAAAELSALHAAARGHVVMAQSLGRQYVHSRDGRVRISTLRSLESKGLITREPPPRHRLTTTARPRTASASPPAERPPSPPSSRLPPPPRRPPPLPYPQCPPRRHRHEAADGAASPLPDPPMNDAAHAAGGTTRKDPPSPPPPKPPPHRTSRPPTSRPPPSARPSAPFRLVPGSKARSCCACPPTAPSPRSTSRSSRTPAGSRRRCTTTSTALNARSPPRLEFRSFACLRETFATTPLTRATDSLPCPSTS